MPTGFFHHHHGSNPSSGHRGAYGDGNTSAYSTSHRQTGSAAANYGSAARSSGVSADQLQRFDVLLRRPENRECFDCGAKQPRWASTNLGVFFCLRCAGIHRSMGTHISKVKSTNMDAWEEGMIQVMEHIGNTRGRLLYEFNMPANARVMASTETSVVERAIRSKYEKKAFYNPSFDELYKQFMHTPIEGVGSAEAGGAPPVATAGASSPPPNINAPPRRVPPTQQAPLEELWGAPVSSPASEHASPASARPNVTSVADLFSHSGPSSAGAANYGSRNATAWGSSPAPYSSGNANVATAQTAGSPFPSPTSATGSTWFDSNFAGSNGNSRGSGAPSPHSPPTAPASRSNTDDLFQGSGNTSSGGRGAGSKDEILSLFSSAPVAGAGGQSSSSQASPNSAYPMAWQPQTVKPYYYPQ